MRPAELFGTFPRTRQAAWQQLSLFLEGWFGPRTPDDGVSDALILAAERRLGLELPQAVCEAYRLFGNRPEITAAVGLMVPIEDLAIQDGALIVWFDPEDDTMWGIPLERLFDHDPPVRIGSAALRDPVVTGWCDTQERFSQLFVDRALHEAVESSMYGGRAAQASDTLALVDRSFARLDFPDGVYPASPTRLYAAEGALIVVEGTDHVIIGATTYEGYRRAIAPFPDLDWSAVTEEDAFHGPFHERLEARQFVRALIDEFGEEFARRMREES